MPVASPFFFSLLISSTARSNTIYEGRTRGGALIKIEIPDNWNGGLVIYNHGSGVDITQSPDLGPIAALQLFEGYAVAASSYRLSIWPLFKTKYDLQNLVRKFRRKFGVPSEIYLYGFSVGGLVTAQGIEQARLGNVVGAYPVCGVMAGSRYWDGVLDWRLVYDAICSEVPGAYIPGGPTGLPEGFTDSDFTPADLTSALQSCFGLGTDPSARTTDQAARLQLFVDETNMPETIVARNVGTSVYGLFGLIYSKGHLRGKQALGNANVQYEDPGINANIQRVSPHRRAMKHLKRNFTPTGNVGNTKIISISTSKDGRAFIENLQVYRDVVPSSNLTVAVVAEEESSHCEFSQAEFVAGWEALRYWVSTGYQPGVSDIQNGCSQIAATPEFDGPCRFDPAFVIPNLDNRIPPR